MGNNIIKANQKIPITNYIKNNTKNKSGNLGRWILKNNKQENINSYWNNIDNCGDKICGNITETRKMFHQEILNKK